MRPRTAALTFVGALVASAFTPGNSVSPVGMLRVGLSHHATMSLADAVTGSLGRPHPTITSVAPPALLSTPARHLAPVTGGAKCDSTQSRGRDGKYSGHSVSGIYDKLFHSDMGVPYLDSYVPQALDSWNNWDGAGHDLVVLGMYRVGHHSYLVGLDPKSGSAVGTVQVDESHLGGIAFFGDWLFTGDNPWPKPGSPTVQKYKISDLRAAMQQAIKTHGQPYLRGDGPRQNLDATDFMTVDGDSLYTGNHGNAGVPGLMNRYVLKPDGSLKKVEGPWTVPDRAQGLVITPDDFIFSTDNNTRRGAMYVVRRAAPAQTKAPVACIWMPAMPEDMTVHNGQVISVFESGTARFAHDHPDNQIAHLHSGSLEALLSAVDPVALETERALGIAPPGSTPTTPTAPAPTVPLPTIPLPTIPLLPGVPAPGGAPAVPGLPGLGQVPVVGGLTQVLTPPQSATPAPTQGPAAGDTAAVPEPVGALGVGSATPGEPAAGLAPATGGLLSGLTGGAPADPAAPSGDGSKRSGRVSDALDLYNSQLDRTGALLESLLGGTGTAVPDTSPAAAASPAPTASPAPAVASVGGGPDPTGPAPEAQPVADAPVAPVPADPIAVPAPAAAKASQPEVWLPSKPVSANDSRANSAPRERVSDARDLYQSQNSTAAVISG